MPILHMQTEAVRATGQQINQTSESLRQQAQQLRGRTQQLANEWQGPSASMFEQEMQTLLQRALQSAEMGVVLNERVQREVDEWERAGATLGNLSDIIGNLVKGVTGAIGSMVGGLGSGGTNESSSYQSPYDVEKEEFKWDADELIDFSPSYGGKELGITMKELDMFLRDNLENIQNGNLPENPELVEKMAKQLGITEQEAQHQYNKLLEMVQRGGLSDPIGPLFQSHWGDIQQLRFGKVVGDSLGMHPAFAAILSPSGGLIGPGDKEMLSRVLDDWIGGAIDENAINYHAVVHDAAGYLQRYNVSDGYEYMTGGIYDALNNVPLENTPLVGGDHMKGQLSGIIFWQNKLGAKQIPKDVIDHLLAISGLKGLINIGKDML